MITCQNSWDDLPLEPCFVSSIERHFEEVIKNLNR